MQKLELYIKDTDGEYQKLDLFQDETVELTQSIQNVKDIAKVFTDFSKTFTLPATATANKVFMHYYNDNVINGFDARLKTDAIIRLNGIDFKEGKIRLDSVDMKEGSPVSYKVVFFGKLVNLKDLIGDDKLEDLDWLDNFDLIHDSATVQDAFQDGLDYTVNGTLYEDAVISPLISHVTALYYDSKETAAQAADRGNLKLISGGTNGVNWDDLKFSIKVELIIKAIQEQYGINFVGDGLDFSPTSDFNHMYMNLHRKKGTVESQGTGPTLRRKSVDVFPNVSTIVQGAVNSDGEFRVRISDGKTIQIDSNGGIVLGDPLGMIPYLITIDIKPKVGYETKEYGVVLKADFNTGGSPDYSAVMAGNNLVGDNTIDTDLNGLTSVYATPFDFQLEVNSEGDFIALDIDIHFWHYNGSSAYTNQVDKPDYAEYKWYTVSNSNSLEILGSSDFDIKSQIPDIGVLEFLTGLFKARNLTAYYDGDDIRVESLDDYYTNPRTYDITEYVDNDNGTYNVALPFSEVNYNYKKSDTILAKEFSNQNGIDFGELKYKGEVEGKWTGKPYKVELPFEKVMMERLVDIATGNSTEYMYGLMLNDSLEPYKGEPLLFYATRIQPTGTGSISFRDTKATTIAMNQYWVPHNLQEFDNTATESLHFSQEFSEWSGTLAYLTLFNKYHQNYIKDVFNTQRRLLKIKAYLPQKVLMNYTLADIFVIGNKEYRINSITANLNTGESELELLNEL